MPSAAEARDSTITHTVLLQVQDLEGTPTIARVHVRDAFGQPWPGGFDADLMTHQDWPWMQGYFYVDGEVSMELPAGPTDIVVGRGFEWRPAVIGPSITSDTTLTVQLRQVFDMRAGQWHSGDVHGHAKHLPSNYPVPPENVMRVVEAEDLAMSWILNPIKEWTGAIDSLSLPEHQVFYSIEHRNQAFGHACLVGLAQLVPTGCCTPPSSAYPLLSMFREEWNPGPTEALTLAHPCTGAGFMDDGGWPAWGLGRELPVLAATGNLDALDIASYSNQPENWELDTYYALLNCGLKIVPSAGTDTALNVYWNRPLGGYRVYVNTGSETLDAGEWVRAYRAGRTFVSNYPLLPSFEVGGAQAGSTLVVTSGQTLPLSVQIQSVLRVDTLEVVINGEVVEVLQLPFGVPYTSTTESTSITVDESSWVAVRVRGTTSIRHACREELLAHSAPIYLEVEGEPVRSTEGAARFIDWCSDLRDFCNERGFASNEQRTEVFGKIQEAEDYYRNIFREAPAEFSLIFPASDASTSPFAPTTYVWESTSDPEAGDRISYRWELRQGVRELRYPAGSDTSFVFQNREEIEGLAEWRAVAEDLGGNLTVSEGDWRPINFDGTAVSIPDEPGQGGDGKGDPDTAAGAPTIEAVPNPSDGRLLFALTGLHDGGWLAIHDATGRLVRRFPVTAAPGSPGGVRGAQSLEWDGRSANGVAVPAGVYWAKLHTKGGVASRRIVRTR